MASLRDMRTKIQSVKNTQQITRAMRMVSAAKLRRAQDQIVNMRPYAQKIFNVISDVSHSHSVEHKLLTAHEEIKKILLIVVTSDRGLCGGFNNTVCRFTEKFISENKSKYERMDFIFVGRKGGDYFKRRGIKPISVMLNMARELSYSMAADIAKTSMQQFAEGDYDEIRIIYNEFKSAISQKLVVERLLPIELKEPANEGKKLKDGFSATDLIFEPKPEDMIDELLAQHFSIQVYRCMAESVAAEHAARMTAMENATKNAKEMIMKMTLVYNNVRQAAITKELIEICSGAEAVNN